jgi:hypothetical protein
VLLSGTWECMACVKLNNATIFLKSGQNLKLVKLVLHAHV